MTDFKQLQLSLDELKKTAGEARLPTDKKELIDCYAPFLEMFSTAFAVETAPSKRLFHFAATYGLVKLHAKLIDSKLVCNQSRAGTFRSFVESDDSQNYHKTLLNFLKKHEKDFQEYRRSKDAEKYIIYREGRDNVEHDREFHFGEEMNSENHKSISRYKSSSLAQLEKRIFVVTYFEMYEQEVNATLTMNRSGVVLSNAAAAILFPAALLVTVASSLLYTSYSELTNGQKKAALEDNPMKSWELSAWKRELKELLSQPRTAEVALKNFDDATKFTSRKFHND